MNPKTKNKINGIRENWDDVWDQEKNISIFGKRLHNQQKKCIKQILFEIKLPKNAKILDIGCGSGRSLEDIRDLGYDNSIGIDTSIKSIKLCKSRNFLKDRDVFLKDGKNTDYLTCEFDLVFSQGLLEHFEDFSPFTKEMTRISNQYILIFQPNHFSFFRKIVDLIRGTPVDEFIHYRVIDFINSFEKYQFKYIKQKKINFNEQTALLFKKEKK